MRKFNVNFPYAAKLFMHTLIEINRKIEQVIMRNKKQKCIRKLNTGLKTKTNKKRPVQIHATILTTIAVVSQRTIRCNNLLSY